MPQTRPAEPLPSLAALRPVASALAALAGEIHRQDGLDLLAVMAGLKPVCLLGRGTDDADWIDAVLGLARQGPLLAVEGPPWEPAGDLPAWYLAATARRREKQRVLYLCADDETCRTVETLCLRGRVSPEAEAALLGYPPCCVAQHHAQALDLERRCVERLIRLTGSDPTRMERMVETGAAEDWQHYEAAGKITPSRATSVNMCDACARSPDSPAARLDRAYAELAAASSYPAAP